MVAPDTPSPTPAPPETRLTIDDIGLTAAYFTYVTNSPTNATFNLRVTNVTNGQTGMFDIYYAVVSSNSPAPSGENLRDEATNTNVGAVSLIEGIIHFDTLVVDESTSKNVFLSNNLMVGSNYALYHIAVALNDQISQLSEPWYFELYEPPSPDTRLIIDDIGQTPAYFTHTASTFNSATFEVRVTGVMNGRTGMFDVYYAIVYSNANMPSGESLYHESTNTNAGAVSLIDGLVSFGTLSVDQSTFIPGISFGGLMANTNYALYHIAVGRDDETSDVSAASYFTTPNNTFSLALGSYSTPINASSNDTLIFTTPNLNKTNAYRIEVSNTSGHAGDYYDMSFAWADGTSSPEQGRLTMMNIISYPLSTLFTADHYLPANQWIFLPKSNNSYLFNLVISRDVTQYKLKISEYRPTFEITNNRVYDDDGNYTENTITRTMSRHILKTNTDKHIGSNMFYIIYMPPTLKKINFEMMTVTNVTTNTNNNVITTNYKVASLNFPNFVESSDRSIRLRTVNNLFSVTESTESLAPILPYNINFTGDRVIFLVILPDGAIRDSYGFLDENFLSFWYSE